MALEEGAVARRGRETIENGLRTRHSRRLLSLYAIDKKGSVKTCSAAGIRNTNGAQ